ncbi:MAG: NADP-dependent oxidoreductase [Microbacteriaceae bacterium]
MRAIGVQAFGGPDALELLDLPEPHAGAGEVRIAVRAATVNPTDRAIRSGAHPDVKGKADFPYVPGMEVAGVLDEIGDGAVADLHVGDAVIAIVVPSGARGAYAQFVVVPVESVVAAPKGASFAEAATLPMNGLTAAQALDRLGVRPGMVVAVTGAAGAVGGYAVQLAKAAGARVVADSSDADAALIRSLGADHLVRRGADVAADIRAAVPNGVDAFVNASAQGPEVFGAVRDGGAVAAVRQYDGDTERGIELVRVQVRPWAREQARLDALRRQADDGVVTLRVARTFRPEDAADAHRQLEAGGNRGRLVIEF